MKKRKITKDNNQKITYASSGVNIEKANDLIEEIKPIIKKMISTFFFEFINIKKNKYLKILRIMKLIHFQVYLRQK